MEEQEYEFKSFKEKQAHFKRISEERGKFLFISRYPYDRRKETPKGKTYVKPKRRIINEGGNV